MAVNKALPFMKDRIIFLLFESELLVENPTKKQISQVNWEKDMEAPDFFKFEILPKNGSDHMGVLYSQPFPVFSSNPLYL